MNPKTTTSKNYLYFFLFANFSKSSVIGTISIFIALNPFKGSKKPNSVLVAGSSYFVSIF